MRVFIGIGFSDELKSRVKELQNDFKKYVDKGRWNHIDNFHLTLKFLGEADDEQINRIGKGLKLLCSKNPSIALRVSSLGQFPEKRSINDKNKGYFRSGNKQYAQNSNIREHTSEVRVLWLGLDGEISKLTSLYHELENTMHIIGFEKEKREYTPHITIAQDITLKGEALLKRNSIDTNVDRVEYPLKRMENTFNNYHFPDIIVDRLILYKSEQVGGKRVYTSIGEHLLKSN